MADAHAVQGADIVDALDALDDAIARHTAAVALLHWIEDPTVDYVEQAALTTLPGPDGMPLTVTEVAAAIRRIVTGD